MSCTRGFGKFFRTRGTPVDYTSYYLANLDSLSSTVPGDWREEYVFTKVYVQKQYSPESVRQLSKGLDEPNALQNGGRPFGHPWLCVECKDVKATGSLDEMRAFLARVYDTTLLRSHGQYLGAANNLRRIHALDPTQVGFGAASDTYRGENASSYNAIARTADFSIGTAPMSNYYFIRRFENISIGSQELTRFKSEICDWIDQELPSSV